MSIVGQQILLLVLYIGDGIGDITTIMVNHITTLGTIIMMFVLLLIMPTKNTLLLINQLINQHIDLKSIQIKL